MRFLSSFLLLCGLILLFCMGAAQAKPMRLPVEVMGPNNVAKYEAVTLPAGTTATALRLTMHGLTYPDKASVRVSNGTWIPLHNSTAQVDEPGKSYGGIGGGFGTISMTVPLARPVTGQVTIGFRFNHTDGISDGFRVLAFNLLSATGTPLLPDTAFVQDDPAQWMTPLTGAAAIAAGDALWHSAPLVENSLAGAPAMTAVCADCHAHDGADLHYFNYSNYSIEERSKFHGLTITQGKQIASYIRSRPGPAPGRPWNPPFQPGPGLDERPAAEWSAGAGLSAVLPTDAAMLPYLFPNGVSKEAVATGGTLNMRELPVAFQMLDWNRWLPTISPKDAFADFAASAVLADYNALQTGLTQSATDPAYLSQLPRIMDAWWGDKQNFLLAHEGAGTPWTPAYARAVYSVGQWQAVKTWEMQQEFALNDKAPLLYGAGGEARSWLNFAAFSASPAFSGIPEVPGLLTPDNLGYEYLTSAWYYAGIVVNSGNRHPIAWRPVDWGYANGRIFDLARLSHVPEMLRFTAMSVKAMQQTADSQWNPFWVYGLDRAGAWNGTQGVPAESLPLPADTPAHTQGTVLDAVVGAWLDQNVQYAPAYYYAAGQASASDPLGPYNSLSTTYYGQETLATDGVSADTLQRLGAWGQTLWPAQNWAAWTGEQH